MALAAGARVQARALLRPWSRVPSAAPGRTPAAGGGGPGARCFGSPRVLVEPDPAAVPLIPLDFCSYPVSFRAPVAQWVTPTDEKKVTLPKAQVPRAPAISLPWPPPPQEPLQLQLLPIRRALELCAL